MAKMTSRERVVRALNHQETDRVPIDIGGVYNLTTLHRDAYMNLIDYLGYRNDRVVVSNINFQSVFIDEYIRQRFKADCYPIYLQGHIDKRVELVKEENGDMWYQDIDWGVKWKCPYGGVYFEPVSPPLMGAAMADVEKFPWPDPYEPWRVAGLKEQAQTLFENTGYALVANSALGGGIFEPCRWLMGYEELFIKMVTEPEMVTALLERVTQFQIGQWDALLNEVGNYVQVVVMSDDLGTQQYPLINPEMYRDMIKPFHAEIASFIKSKADVKILYHCDGAVRDFLPDLIEIGIDAWNPVQVTCNGLEDTAALKKDFGDKLSFWGAACDSRHVLVNKSPQQIREEVKSRIYDLAPGGGLVVSSVHNIPRDVPAENIVAFYDALYEFGIAFYQR